jgi:signal peptidase I
LFWALWFVVVPLALAVTVVGLFDSSTDTGLLVTFVREQRVPAGIVLFTIFEMSLYYFRHRLPLASQAVSASQRGLPIQLRKDVEAATHLLDEANRILEKRGKAIGRELSESKREVLRASLSELEAAIKADPFDPTAFSAAYAAGRDQVDIQLGPWRKGETREYIESIGIAILVALMLRAVVIEAFKIPSGSMLPTLQIGDHLFVNKFVYGPTIPFVNTRLFDSMPPKHGDIIVFEYPDPDLRRDRQDFIKRVMALPGDVLEVDDGHPIINGWRVPSCEVGHYFFTEGPGTSPRGGQLFIEYLEGTTYFALFEDDHLSEKEGPYLVKPGELWVMGDNRHNSMDSRKWLGGRGAGVPFANIKGRAMFIWFPTERLFTNVMGTPELPKGAPPEILAGIERCLAMRPPDAETIPPPPRAP